MRKNEAMSYHVVPPYGLLNDPNGLIYFKGLYHVFFQWNPNDCDHSYKCWGHATSSDLFHFDYHEAALLPDQWYDVSGCYSGSAIEFDGKMYIYYTGNVFDDLGQRQTYQCLAISDDGFTFVKHGPILYLPSGYTAHFRDPKVFFDRNQKLTMVIGAQRINETGTIVVAHSTDGLTWEVIGELLDQPLKLGYMWECPDLILGDPYDILMFSPQGVKREKYQFQNIFHSGYLVGHFNEGKFSAVSEFKELDYGFEFYAPQSMLGKDGRPILSAWMGAMEKEKERSLPTLTDGWIHHLSMFREIFVNKKGLVQKPLSSLVSRLKEIGFQEGNSGTCMLPRVGAIQLDFTSSFSLESSQDWSLTYSNQDNYLAIHRKNWSDQNMECRYVPMSAECTKLLIYIDQTSMEIFVNEGESTASLRVFFDEKVNSFEFRSDEIMQCTCYSLTV